MNQTTDSYFFLDESGDHGLKFIDGNFPIFLLCGVLIPKNELTILQDAFDQLKRDLWNSTDVIFHSRDIRKLNNPFQVLFNEKKKIHFYQRINTIFRKTNFQIIASGINKKNLIQQYGKTAQNPYELSLGFLLERMIDAMKDAHLNHTEIWIEKRGKKEDTLLLEYYNRTIDLGSYYVKPEEFKVRINHFAFRSKSDNDVGIQLADLAAYPLARHLLAPTIKSPSFEIIKPKIYHKNGDKLGLKFFP